MKRKIVIGSRGSDLALWQANFVKEKLESAGKDVTIKVIKTQGDRIQHLSFDKMEGKGFFTKEIEAALLDKEIDLAVHSHKDLETTPPEGLTIAGVSSRENPADVLLIRKEALDTTEEFSLKKGAVVGTSSARRKAQILSYRTDIRIEDLRGNVPTRVQKLRDGQYDAIILAAAGLSRLNLDIEGLHAEEFDPVIFVPAPAQGVLAYQVRNDDVELQRLIERISDSAVKETSAVERKILNKMDGGCQLPLGVLCRKEKGVYHLWVSYAEAWDSFPKRIHLTSQIADELPELALKQLQKNEKRSIYISREIEENSYFYKALSAKGFEVNGSSLIEIQPVRFSSIPQTDWIFFSSRQAVQHFFEQTPVMPEGVKFAVIGKGTAGALKRQGITPDFTGRSADTSEVGREFNNIVNSGSTILFPQARKSLRSVQKELSFSARVIDLYVYDTREKDVSQIPQADILVFTSPSNVRSFFKQASIGKEQRAVAIGKTTAAALNAHGVKNVKIAWAPNDVSLVDEVMSI